MLVPGRSLYAELEDLEYQLATAAKTVAVALAKREEWVTAYNTAQAEYERIQKRLTRAYRNPPRL